MTSEFEMKNMSMMHYFLGQELWHKTDEIFPKLRKIYSENIKEVQVWQNEKTTMMDLE